MTTEELKEQLERELMWINPHHRKNVLRAIVPKVEQAIQQVREQTAIAVRDDEYAICAVALAEKDAHILMIETDAEQAHEVARQMLREKDAQIAKLTAFIENLKARGIEEVPCDEFKYILENYRNVNSDYFIDRKDK